MEGQVDVVMKLLGEQGMRLTKLVGGLEEGHSAVVSKDEHSSFIGCRDMMIRKIFSREFIAIHYPFLLFKSGKLMQ